MSPTNKMPADDGRSDSSTDLSSAPYGRHLASKAGWGLALPIALAMLVGLGIVVAEWRTRSLDLSLRAELLTNAADIARSIEPELVKALTFTASDGNLAAFNRLNEYLRNFSTMLPIAGIYTQALRDNVIVFGPESYDPGSALSSEPGTPYNRPTRANQAIFNTGIPFTQGPYTDEYGTFVSGFAPVLDPPDRRGAHRCRPGHRG